MWPGSLIPALVIIQFDKSVGNNVFHYFSLIDIGADDQA